MSLILLPEKIYERCDRVGWTTARNKELYFIQDWTSVNFPNWFNFCSSFIGKENIGYLEIGSYQGFSACWFLDVILRHPTNYAYLIEKVVVPELNDNIKKIDFKGELKIINDLSENVLKNINQQFDIIYIDGDHTTPATLNNGNLCWPLLKENGVMIFDDYLWTNNPDEMKRPKNGIDLFLKNIDKKYQLLHSGYQIIIKKEKALKNSVIQSDGNQYNRSFQENSFVCRYNMYKQGYI